MGLKSVELARETLNRMLEDIKPERVEPGMTQWEGVKVYTLYSTPEIGNVRYAMEKGKTFPRHSHKMCETFHVFHGKISITLDDGTVRVMTAPCTATLGERVAHTVTALEDAEACCVTMPRWWRRRCGARRHQPIRLR